MTGARSVSDLTRDSMRVLLNGANRENVFGSGMDEFRSEIRSLNKKIEQLAVEIATSKADSTHD